MKQDENYIYPQEPDEVAKFYGFKCEVCHSKSAEKKGVWDKTSVAYLFRNEYYTTYKLRIALPDLEELKVGDLLRIWDGDIMEILDNHILESFKNGIKGKSCELLVGRNTWVKVKT